MFSEGKKQVCWGIFVTCSFIHKLRFFSVIKEIETLPFVLVFSLWSGVTVVLKSPAVNTYCATCLGMCIAESDHTNESDIFDPRTASRQTETHPEEVAEDEQSVLDGSISSHLLSADLCCSVRLWRVGWRFLICWYNGRRRAPACRMHSSCQAHLLCCWMSSCRRSEGGGVGLSLSNHITSAASTRKPPLYRIQMKSLQSCWCPPEAEVDITATKWTFKSKAESSQPVFTIFTIYWLLSSEVNSCFVTQMQKRK